MSSAAAVVAFEAVTNAVIEAACAAVAVSVATTAMALLYTDSGANARFAAVSSRLYATLELDAIAACASATVCAFSNVALAPMLAITAPPANIFACVSSTAYAIVPAAPAEAFEPRAVRPATVVVIVNA